MLELKYVKDNLDEIQEMLKNRNTVADLALFKEADDRRREILFQIEELRHRRNVVSDQIAALKKQGENADALVADMRQVAATIKNLETPLSEVEATTHEILMQIPNLPHESVPVGQDETDNPTIKTIGDLPAFEYEPKPHWDLGENLNILDFDRAAKISGARFPLYFGAGARLKLAGPARRHAEVRPCVIRVVSANTGRQASIGVRAQLGP